jgi:hypothetical protein
MRAGATALILALTASWLCACGADRVATALDAGFVDDAGIARDDGATGSGVEPSSDGAVEGQATGSALESGSPVDSAAALSGPTDVLVSDSTQAGPGNSHGSPSLVVDGLGNVAVVFDATDEDLTVHAVGWSRSTNGGASFTDQGSFPDPADGGVTDNYGYPCIARDAVIGNLYVASLGSGPNTSNAIAFNISPSAGARFNPALNAADPNLASSDFIDFPAIAVDNASGYTQGLVYIVYADFVGGGTSAVKLRLSTYTDHAFAVTEVVSPALGTGDEASLPSVAVAPDHGLSILYYSQVGNTASVSVVSSTDQGEHFGSPVVVAPLHMPLVAGAFSGGLGLSGQGADGGVAPVDLYSAPQLAINPASGALYAVFVDATQGDKANIYFTQSADRGATWRTPVQVNDDATSNDQFLPALAVSPDGARLAIDFYDRRDDAANLLANRYGVTASVSGSTVTFGPNFRVSPSPFPVLVDNPLLSPGYFSIHTSMAVDATYFYDAYTDARDGHLDIRLARYGERY